MRSDRRPGELLAVHDLTEYVYCPRAAWYRRHPPAGGPSGSSLASSARGVEFHARYLTAERRVDSSLPFAVGLLLTAVGLLALGLYWWGHP